MIGCIWQDALLIDEIKLDTKDFLTEDGAYYFALAKQLRSKGFSSFDEVTVLSNISETVEIGFNDRGGWDTIQNLTEIINGKNWETYLDILYRENIIKGLYNDGFNLMNPTESNGKKIIPINLFRKMDSESVLDWYESRLSGYGTGYSSKILEEEEIEITDVFLKELEDGIQNGVPFDTAGLDINAETMNCFPFLSSQINGLINGTSTILGGYSSTGKTTAWVTVIMGLLFRGRKVLIISNEQRSKVFKVSFIVWILAKHFRYYNVTKKKMISGNTNDEDKRYIKLAQEYWNVNYDKLVKFISIPDANMSLVKKKVRENVLKYGYDTVLYDTLKLDFADNNEQHFASLIKDSRELDYLAKKYDIIMLCSLQLALNTLGKLFLDSSVLSMSKQIKEVLENLILMRTVYSEELDKENNRYYCRPFQLKKINGEWVEQEYEVDPTAVYRMVFVDKNRNGDNSGDTGVAYLWKFAGATGIFREVAQCRPRHGHID